MKRSRKGLYRCAIALGLSLSLIAGMSGCSKGNGSGDKKVTLKLITWTNEATVDALNELNKNFNAKYPNINVEVTAVSSGDYAQLVQTRIAANDVDLIAQQEFYENPEYTKGLDDPACKQYADNGDFLDITKEDFIKNYDSNAVKDAASIGGKVYAVPLSRTSYNGVFYNKDIFAKYNLQVPQTWDEFMNICKTLKANGIAPLTVGGKDEWPVSVAAYAVVSSVISDSDAYMKALWTGEAKFTDEQSELIFQRLEELASYYEEGVMGIDYNSVPGRFAAGKTAMLTDGAWQAPQIEKANADLKFGYFPIPMTEKGSDVAQLRGKYDTMFAGNGKSKNKDAILKWMSFISEKDNYQKFIDKICMESTMTGVTCNDEFLLSLAPMSKDFKLNFQWSYFPPKGIGQYGGFQMSKLKVLGGTVASAQELAKLSQQDWDTAIAAAQ